MAGGFVVELEAGAGAGAAGVLAGAGAGVAGAFGPEDEAAGAIFGYGLVNRGRGCQMVNHNRSHLPLRSCTL